MQNCASCYDFWIGWHKSPRHIEENSLPLKGVELQDGERLMKLLRGGRFWGHQAGPRGSKPPVGRSARRECWFRP